MTKVGPSLCECPVLRTPSEYVMPAGSHPWIAHLNNKGNLHRLVIGPMTHGGKQEAFHFRDARF
jgi:hypothetical protein